MRVIAFIEGCLMYYDVATVEHKIKIATLIRNEIRDIFYKFKDDEPSARTPFFKMLPKKTIASLDVIPLTTQKEIDNFKAKGVSVLDLSKEDAASFVKTFANFFNKAKKQEKEKSENKKILNEGNKTEQDLQDLIENPGMVDNLFDDTTSPTSTSNSLDAIADKIATRQ